MAPVAQCPDCGQVKPTADFYPSKAKRGHFLNCKACSSEKNAARYKKYRESGSKDQAFALVCEQRKVARLNNRLRLCWYLVIQLRHGDLTRAIEAKAETKRLAAIERMRTWLNENPERFKAGAARRRHENRGQHRAWGRAYSAKKLQAVPPWSNPDVIREIYELARRMEELTGQPWHVDHIVPLQHPLVCGLHCEANLRPVLATTNLRKGNRFWPDMPEVIRA